MFIPKLPCPNLLRSVIYNIFGIPNFFNPGLNHPERIWKIQEKKDCKLSYIESNSMMINRFI